MALVIAVLSGDAQMHLHIFRVRAAVQVAGTSKLRLHCGEISSHDTVDISVMRSTADRKLMKQRLQQE